MDKLPRLPHVKYVRTRNKVYAYFNTGTKKHGRVIYAPLPHPGSVGFYDTYASLKAGRTKRAARAFTIEELAIEFEESLHFKSRAAGTQKFYRYTLKRIIETLGDFPVNDLKREDLQTVLDHAMTGPGAHNAFMAVLGVLYTWARRRGKTDLEPVKDIPKMETGEHQAWPDKVLEAGLQAENDSVRLAVHLLYFTGQRIGDVMNMRWSDVKGGRVAVTQQKTGKKLRIRINSELQAELDRTPKRGMFIVTNEDGTPATARAIRKAIKALGGTFGLNIVPHGLRKNAVISLLEAGCTVAETAAITGQTYAIVEHYARQVDQEKLGDAAILKLENKRRTGKPYDKLAGKSN